MKKVHRDTKPTEVIVSHGAFVKNCVAECVGGITSDDFLFYIPVQVEAFKTVPGSKPVGLPSLMRGFPFTKTQSIPVAIWSGFENVA